MNTFNSPVSLPAVGGYSSSITVPSASASGSLSVTVSTKPLSGASMPSPALNLLYVYLTPSANMTLSGFPAFTFTVPVSTSGGVTFWLAAIDASGNVTPFAAGPGVVSGNTVTFAAGTTPLSLSANAQYTIVLYELPAPPGQMSVSPSSDSLTSVGQTAQSTVSESGYSGSYTVSSADTSVATASVSGSTVTVTAQGAGQTKVTVLDAYGQTATIDVGVTISGVVVNKH